MHLQDARLEKIRRMHSRARGSTNIWNKRNRERDLINIDIFYHREELKYELDPKRDRFTGHVKPGEKLGKGYYHYSEEGEKRKAESARRTSKAMNNKAGSNWGRNLDRRKRIICIETKEQYLGIKDTAESIGTYYSHFYYALKKGISINGHHYTII